MNDRYLIDGEKHQAIISTMKKLLADRSKRVEFEGKNTDFGNMPDGRPIATLIPIPGTYGFSWEAMEYYLKFCEANDGYTIE